MFVLFEKGVKRKRKLQLRDDPPCDRPRAKPAKPKPCDKSVKPCDKPLKPVKAQSQSHSAVVDAEDGAETCAWAHATLRVLGAAPQGVADPQHAERVASADLHFLLEGPVSRAKARRGEEPLFCFCQLPEFAAMPTCADEGDATADAEDAAAGLICCDGCEEWYHPPCARLARADLPATEEDDFHCALCCHSDKGDAGPLLKLADDSSECWRRLLPNATRAVVANALKGAAQLADCRAQGTEAIAALRTVLEDCDAWAARCDARLHAEPASASREQIHSLAVLICQGQMLEVDHDRASRLSALRSALAEAAVGTRLS